MARKVEENKAAVARLNETGTANAVHGRRNNMRKKQDADAFVAVPERHETRARAAVAVDDTDAALAEALAHSCDDKGGSGTFEELHRNEDGTFKRDPAWWRWWPKVKEQSDTFSKWENARKAWQVRRAADPTFKGKQPARPKTPDYDRFLAIKVAESRSDATADRPFNLSDERLTEIADLIEEQEKAMPTPTKASKSAKPARSSARTDIRYFHDGKSMSESHKHKLSTVAYFYSEGITSSSSPRQSTKEFIATLRKLGIEDPGAPGWMVELPNGVTIECRKDGESSKFKGEPAPKKASAPAKAQPKKQSERKTSKAAAKKAPAKKREVTPLPKKAAAKKTVAAAATRKRTARK